MNGKIITHFTGLKPKAYCYKVYGDEKEHKKSKGVVKHKVSNQLSYKTYEETLNRNGEEDVSFNTIRSKNHQIYSINQTRCTLSNYDNKRYWYSDFEGLPFGHYAIKYVHNEKMILHIWIHSTTERLCQRIARHRRYYKSYLNNRNPPKHYPNSMKSFDEFGAENCKMFLIEECPRKNRKQLKKKKDGEYVENEKNRLNRCIVGRTKKEFCNATREHHLEETK